MAESARCVVIGGKRHALRTVVKNGQSPRTTPVGRVAKKASSPVLAIAAQVSET